MEYLRIFCFSCLIFFVFDFVVLGVYIQHDWIISHKRTRVCSLQLLSLFSFGSIVIHIDLKVFVSMYAFAGWFLGMLIQHMSAIKLLRGISRKLSSFAFGASTGM